MEPRPTQHNASVLDDFYQQMGEMLFKDSDMAAGMSLDRIVEGLKYAGKPPFDGYEYAKLLEQNGWSGISAQDIETLDCAFSLIRAAVEKAETEWVKRNKLTPQFASGDKVRAEIHRLLPGAKKMERSIVDGYAYIEERNLATGHCVFRDQQWIETRGDQGGYILCWEDVVVIQ